MRKADDRLRRLVREAAVSVPLMPYIPPPETLRGFPTADRVKPKGNRRRWKDDRGRTLEWDYQHGRVEVYDGQGAHLGEFDPETGEQTKDADPGRRIDR